MLTYLFPAVAGAVIFNRLYFLELSKQILPKVNLQGDKEIPEKDYLPREKKINFQNLSY